MRLSTFLTISTFLLSSLAIIFVSAATITPPPTSRSNGAVIIQDCLFPLCSIDPDQSLEQPQSRFKRRSKIPFPRWLREETEPSAQIDRKKRRAEKKPAPARRSITPADLIGKISVRSEDGSTLLGYVGKASYYAKSGLFGYTSDLTEAFTFEKGKEGNLLMRGSPTGYSNLAILDIHNQNKGNFNSETSPIFLGASNQASKGTYVEELSSYPDNPKTFLETAIFHVHPSTGRINISWINLDGSITKDVQAIGYNDGSLILFDSNPKDGFSRDVKIVLTLIQ